MIFATLLVVVTHGLKGHSSSLWESQHDRSVRQLVHLRSGSYERLTQAFHSLSPFHLACDCSNTWCHPQSRWVFLPQSHPFGNILTDMFSSVSPNLVSYLWHNLFGRNIYTVIQWKTMAKD